MTAKHQQLSIGIGIIYLLSKLHDIWWKNELSLIFLKFQSTPCLCLPTVPCRKTGAGAGWAGQHQTFSCHKRLLPCQDRSLKNVNVENLKVLWSGISKSLKGTVMQPEPIWSTKLILHLLGQWPSKVWFWIRFPIRVIHFHSTKHADNEMGRSLKLGKNCFSNQIYGAPTTMFPGRFMATVRYSVFF